MQARGLLLMALWASFSAWGDELKSDALPGSRGSLLYETHCGTCHTRSLHWREKRLATDWASLNRQVARWQDNAGLNWEADDIDAVARYLNESIYHYPVQ